MKKKIDPDLIAAAIAGIIGFGIMLMVIFNVTRF
jgi:hypothetical protein